MVQAATFQRLTQLLNNADLVTPEQRVKMVAALPRFDEDRAQEAIDKIEKQPCPQPLRNQVRDLLNHPCLFRNEKLPYVLKLGNMNYRQARQYQAELQAKVDSRAAEHQAA